MGQRTRPSRRGREPREQRSPCQSAARTAATTTSSSASPRRAGHSVFGITVDRDGKSWFPRLFGQGAFALIPHPEKLTQALPQIYRQLVTG